ncbi:MAG: metal ABC transporter permease [Candidatus Hydrogenedentota bacterium]
MTELFSALTDPDIPFLRYAFLAGVLASVSFGMVGTFVVVRRLSYIAGAIAHCVLGGVGAALYGRDALGWAWCDPMLGALAAALLSALVVGWASIYAHEREDTVIGALWAVGMGVGLLFIAKTPGYADPMSYLFGNILLISRTDLYLIAALDATVVVLCLAFYNKFLAVCFDPEFARLRGVQVERYYLLLVCLVALTVVLLLTVVGLIMVIALLTLPAATANRFTQRMVPIMALAVLFCLLYTQAGLAASYVLAVPSGPSIIIVSAACYLVVMVAGGLLRRL